MHSSEKPDIKTLLDRLQEVHHEVVRDVVGAEGEVVFVSRPTAFHQFRFETFVFKEAFKDEGLEPELVKCSWAAYKDNLALGAYDITHHLVMYFLKPIEQ